MLSDLIKFFILLSSGYLLTWTLSKVLIPFLSKHSIDKPNERSSHYKKTPTSGGLVFVLVTQLLILFSKSLIPIICLPLAIVGFFDDKYNISSKFRYFVQFTTSVSLCYYTFFYNKDFVLVNGFFIYFLILIISFCITAVINLINFMDGIDGLVGGSMCVVFLIMSITYSNNLILVFGSLLGFLYWNWNPAKVFMGDVGSTYLGAIFSGFILEVNSWNLSLWYLLILSPLFFDSITCIFIRLLNNQNIFTPHKLHLYQRLHQGGLSHKKVSLIYIFFSTLLGFASFFKNYQSLLIIIPIEISVAIYLNKYYAKPFTLK